MDSKDSAVMVDTGVGEAGSQTNNALVAVSDVVDVGTSNNDNDTGIPTMKYKGLQNQGATWYLNSLIQTLYMTPEFRSILYSWSFKEAEDKFNKEYCIPLQLQILFGSLQTSLRDRVKTKGLTKSFNWQSNEVSYQQDIQEFSRVLFDAIEESFKAINKPCLINQLYQGAMSDFLKCTEWGYERNIYSEFMDLSLPIQDPWNNINNSSLQQALENYVRPEVLDDDNKYEWSGCNKKVRAVKGHIFQNLPEVLVIQLNRFTFNMYGNAIKINDKVTFPYVLNMNKFMKEDIATKIKQTEDKMNDEDQQENAPVIVAEETEEEKRQRNIDEVNQKLDAMIENSKEKEDLENKEMSVEDTHHSGPKDVEMIDDEGIDYSDPMNSLAGPKEYVYGLDDDNHVDYSLRGDAVGSNKTKLIDLSFKPRDETEILAEIDRDIKDYVQQGEWVYYLYSVLIHSGGVGGGHYSAYIRSFEDKQWYHFNDSKVSEISSGRIEEMYGDGSSSKNAYLVIYKKYKLKETNSSLEVDEASNPVITDDEIPDYIKEEVEIDNNAFRQEEIEREKEQAEQKERLSHITLRFYSKVHREERSTAEIYSNKVALDDPNVLLDEKKYDFKNYYTIKQAHEDAYKLYGLESKGIAFENTQLRMYSVAFKILKQSFEDSYEKTLQDLGINMSTPLFLETKLPNEIFESLSPDVIPIRYYLWTEGLVSLDEQFLTHHRLFINKNNTLRDLQQDILVNMTEKEILQESQTLENIILYKEKYTNTGVSLNELTLPDQLNRTIDSLNITEGNRIFVDFRGDSDSKTNWEKEFTQHENRYQINFNNPFNGSPDQWANDEYRSFESTYNNTVFLEYQQTCLEMKQAISSVLNLNIDEFKIMTAGIRYEEIRDLSQTLCEAGLYKNSRIFVELGTPTHAGAIKVLIYEAIFNHDEDNELFKYSDLLFELNVGKDFSVREFKAMVAKEYQHRFMPDATEELHRDRIRIRDKGVERLGKIMRDGRKIHEYGICNNKVYAIQILDYEESIVDDNDIMLVVREWNPNNITGALTKKKEILLNRKFRHHEITEALKNQGLIPDEGVNVEDYDICKVNSISKFMVEDLPHEKWTKLNSNGGFTALEGAPLYIRSDGYLVIIRNREYFKAAPIINDADMPLPVGSIYDAVSSKYDKFDIKSSAHRLPYVGGKAPQQKGMTIKVIS